MNKEAMGVQEASLGYLTEAKGLDVPRGYKWTEVGVIPEDWDVMHLSDLGSVVRGGSPRPAGDPRYFGGTYMSWLTVAALTRIPDYRQKVREAVGYLTEEGIKFSRILEPGTLIISNSGATLGVAKILDFQCCANDGIAALINQKAGRKDFLCYYINTRTRYLREIVATGNGQPNLNTERIRRIAVPYPSLVEQCAIAEALSDVDNLIGALDNLIAKKRTIKQATMQQLLTGKTRLPGFSGDWKTVRLHEVADKRIPFSFVGGPFGSNLKASEYTPSGVRIIQLQNIGDGTFHDDYAIFTSQQKADELKSCNIFPGEILISKMGEPVARACLAPIHDSRYLMASDGIRLAVDRRHFSKHFVLYFLNSKEFRKQAIEASTGTTRMRIGLTTLKNLLVRSPSLSEQTAIAKVLFDMDVHINALEQRRQKAGSLKQGMMQQLLTGRIRLVKPEQQEVSA